MAERKIEIVDQDGKITMGEEVIASIARIATGKVDGIVKTSPSGGFRGIFGGEDLSPNIRTELTDEGVRVELRIAVEYGYPVHEVAQGVQTKVESDITELAGVNVVGVDVYVKKIVPPPSHADAAEAE
ncbi:hypothetical protein DRJ12_00320 [Candidatus Acetothermia bacterium]|jgi:uncharacterized alkaline shock family protein YloU|nr:Asp23/Gls24 family envelope stress response protein [Candidatus Bipolaricaulota bacterium]RLE39554.1 MAG: hypothetical protein DRJ12_00320 [Candidatus Acetothermia bacterium]RLE39991.1 MAG: hypothetical protein DRJ23_02810 [Candidatus Acetothermia bacterium]HDJ29736.1 Asp23/Gls24 family envelope stress response protein [Candidatus Acetothermia bacterium]